MKKILFLAGFLLFFSASSIFACKRLNSFITNENKLVIADNITYFDCGYTYGRYALYGTGFGGGRIAIFKTLEECHNFLLQLHVDFEGEQK